MNRKPAFDNSLPTWFIIAAIVLSVIGLNVYLSIDTIEELSETQSSLTNTGDVILELDNLYIMVLLAESGQRGYLLTIDESYLDHYKLAISDVETQMNIVEQLTTEIDGQQQRIDTLLGLIDEKLKHLKQAVSLTQSNSLGAAMALFSEGSDKALFMQIDRSYKQIKQKEYAYRDFLYNRLEKARKESTVTFLISAITSALLLLGMLVLARTNLRSELRHRATLEKQNEILTDKVAERTQELTVYSEELSRSNRELEDFAFVASHDLQEPLRKIRAFGDRLDVNYSKDLDEKGQDYLKRMQNAAQRMSTLISDLLEFSRVTTRGKEFVDVELNQILESISSDLEIAIDESGTTLTIDNMPTIEADPSQMHQLFLNLISNAIKFRKPDVEPRINIQYQQVEQKISPTAEQEATHVFTIKDNGIGFEQSFADKIFSPFQRLHARTEYKGTGIGLAICRRIVERHGGIITAVSTPDEGAEFTIIIPVAGKQQLNYRENL